MEWISFSLAASNSYSYYCCCNQGYADIYVEDLFLKGGGLSLNNERKNQIKVDQFVIQGRTSTLSLFWIENQSLF